MEKEKGSENQLLLTAKKRQIQRKFMKKVKGSAIRYMYMYNGHIMCVL